MKRFEVTVDHIRGINGAFTKMVVESTDLRGALDLVRGTFPGDVIRHYMELADVIYVDFRGKKRIVA